jgi:hypothetical protein
VAIELTLLSLGFTKDAIAAEFEPTNVKNTEIYVTLTQEDKRLQILAGEVPMQLADVLNKWTDWLTFASKKFVSVKKFRAEMYKTLETFRSVNELVETLDKHGFTFKA